MKLGLFSDIHANFSAFDRVVRHLRGLGATGFICAGDTVGYGPDPAQCLELLRSLPAQVVAGNHDRAIAESQNAETGGSLPATGSFNLLARLALDWTISRLGKDDIEYLAGLPLTVEADPFHIVHATPSEPASWRYVLSVQDAEKELAAFNLPVCIIGHSHRPFAVMRSKGRAHQLAGNCPPRRFNPGDFALRPGHNYIVNIGSVGQPRDGDPRACCALYDTETARFTLHRLEYDIPSVQSRFEQAGLPSYLAERLAGGY